MGRVLVNTSLKVVERIGGFLLILLLYHPIFIVFVVIGGGAGSAAIRIQGSVLVDPDMGIVAPLHYGVVDRCWRRGFK